MTDCETIHHAGPEPLTVDEMLASAGRESSDWEVKKFEARAASRPIKIKVGSQEVIEHHQSWNTSLTIAPASPTNGYVLKALEEWGAKRPKLLKPRYRRRKNPLMVELSLCDAHFGKLCWAPETGDDYDPDIAEKTYLNAVDDLLRLVDGKQVGSFLFPVGSDFFHVDSWKGLTTSGTPVGLDSSRSRGDDRFQRVFRIGCRAVEQALLRCREIAPVRCVWVPGNHDYENSWFLMELLRAMFRGDKCVTFDDAMKPRTYIEHGTVMLGLGHGDKPRDIKKYPRVMAIEEPEMWGRCKHREMHIGHHHRVQMLSEEGGVRVRALPSLSGTDAWHMENGFIGAVKAAEAYLWSLDGYVGHFSVSARNE